MSKWMLLLLSAASLNAFAQDADAPVEETTPWSGETELGYTYSSGNTDEQSLLFRQKLIYEAGRWLNTLSLSADYTEAPKEIVAADGSTKTENESTEEKYFAEEKLDYFFTDATYGFGRATWQDDKFSGFEEQMSAVVGIGHSFFPNNETLSFKLELGAGARVERFDKDLEDADGNLSADAGLKTEQAIAYFSDELIWKFYETAELGQTLSVEYGNKNTVTRGNIYVKSQLAAALALKVSYEIEHNDVVPEDTEKTDEKLSVSGLYSF